MNGVLCSFATGQLCSRVKQPFEILPFDVIVLMRVKVWKMNSLGIVRNGFPGHAVS